MYLEHFGLSEPPFSITPDPRFVFLSERHRDALAHLLFGIGQGGGGGFVQLTGEVGTGKTTLCRLLLEQLPDNTRVALVLNPRLSPVELLETVCEELHLDLEGAPGAGEDAHDVAARRSARGSLKALVDLLNAYLLRAYSEGLRVVLIIDEAQNLSTDALEQVRLLTNLETDTQKLLQVILLGQPELRDILAREDMRQLAQRITARFHLTPLEAIETAEYMRHRYRVAGGQRFPFDAGALRRVHAHSGGVPRLINVIGERALLAGYARDALTLDARMVDRAAREALAPRPARGWPLRPVVASTLAMVAVVALLAWWRLAGTPPATATAAPATSASSVQGSTTPAPAPATPAAMSGAPAPPLLSTPVLLARLGSVDDPTTAASTGLLELWEAGPAVAPAAVLACEPVLAPGLYCLRGSGRLDKLATLARPAMLRLRAPPTAAAGVGHDAAWVVLLGVDTARVRLQVADEVLDLPRNSLERLWTGDFIAVWRGPESLAAPLASPSSLSGPALDWVGTRLGADGDPLPASRMMEEARRFQAARGLAADGVIGRETLMALAADLPGPRLQRELE